ncbi:MAG: sulfotransferase, partial [Blastocatellia bacterium]|nr:sulfotransferase [Blastocatellia bacterium]
GLALLRQDRHEESLHQFQEAARLNPDSAAMHHNLGNVLRLLGRASEARAAYMTALQIDPDYAISHYHIGLSLKNEGKLAEALPWYKLAIEIDTENPLLWQHLAELYVEREESGEALFCWERVRALAPCMNVGIHLGMGSALQDEGRLREAMEHYVEAAKLQPESPPIHIKIGGVYEELGQMTEAEAEFRLALSLQPNFVPALARLGTLLRDKLPDADLLAIEARLGDTELQDNQRARLLFSLAHVLDASGNYARAAACLREANSLTLLTTSEHRKYDPSDHSRFIEQIKLCFNHEFFQMIKNSGLKSRCPVFVVGLPRSGTTLVEQILASHPLVHGAGELSLSRQTFSSIPDVVGKHGPPLDRIVNLKGDDIRSLAEGHLDKLRALDGGSAERIIDKLPDNYIYLGILSAMFPDAVFINCRRQYRDVAVSCWMTDFRSIRWANDIGHIASRFKEYHSLMGHWREVLPSPIHAVDYEELVSDFEGTARCLLDFCGLDWDPACLEYYRTSRIVRTASVTQVRKPIYTRSVDRWKNYESDLSDLFQLLQF